MLRSIPFKFCAMLVVASLTCLYFQACRMAKPDPTTFSKKKRILIFSKTAGFYHTSIPKGVAAMEKMAKNNGYAADTTTKSLYFIEDSLKNYSAVVFLNTTGNVLNADQQVAFERYIQAGGGFLGVHAAADTEYDWPWYNKLLGAYFKTHPHIQHAAIDIVDATHLSTQGLPMRWERRDEWYTFRDISPAIQVLANLDEESYQGGGNGVYHPVSWYQEYDGGRSFYTAFGHTDESYEEPLFLKHLLGGLQYVMGKESQLDYSKAYSVKKF